MNFWLLACLPVIARHHIWLVTVTSCNVREEYRRCVLAGWFCFGIFSFGMGLGRDCVLMQGTKYRKQVRRWRGVEVGDV